MAGAICLRCDWQGEAEAPACPACGTALYREGPRTPPESAARGPEPGAGAGPPPVRPRRRAAFVMAGAVTVVAATAAFLWIRSNTPGAKGPRALSGTIVYAEDLGDGYLAPLAVGPRLGLGGPRAAGPGARRAHRRARGRRRVDRRDFARDSHRAPSVRPAAPRSEGARRAARARRSDRMGPGGRDGGRGGPEPGAGRLSAARVGDRGAAAPAPARPSVRRRRLRRSAVRGPRGGR